MFKTIFHTLAVFSLIGATSSLAFAGNATKFIIEAPKTATLDEAVDITIKAVDDDGNVDTNYSGSVFFITSYFADIVPNPGKSIQIDSSHNGIYTFKKGFTFKGKEGNRDISAYDIGQNPIMGKASLQVNAQSAQNNATQNNTTKKTPSQNTTKTKISTTSNVIKKDTSKTMPLDRQTATNYDIWKIIHQSIADKGFEWTAPTSYYLDGNIPKNIKFVNRVIDNKENFIQEYLAELIKEGFTPQDQQYDICLSTLFSGKKLNTSLIRNGAKSCAKTSYGTYFNGKNYTTQEEILMLLSRYYDTPYKLEGIFVDGQFYYKNTTTQPTNIANVQSNVWYAPFLSGAVEVGYISSGSTWKVAQEITDMEIESLNLLYAASYNIKEENTNSIEDQEKTLRKVIFTYNEIHKKYPENIETLKGTPFYDEKNEIYSVISESHITTFNTNFKYETTTDSYSISKK